MVEFVSIICIYDKVIIKIVKKLHKQTGQEFNKNFIKNGTLNENLMSYWLE
jgi:hypothetical protein